MNPHPTPGSPDHPDAADARLRAQLRALQPPAAKIDALGDRVFAQWSERHAAATTAAQPLGAATGAGAVLGLRASWRWRWAGLTTGLVACALVATALWVQRPDPALEDLMQPDVLSQMAIGEM